MDYRWDSFPMQKVVILLESVSTGEVVAFQPELLFGGHLSNNNYNKNGDVNNAVIRFLKIRPMCTKKDMVLFISEYLKGKEIYLIWDKSQPINGWIGAFNLFTQIPLSAAIEQIR